MSLTKVKAGNILLTTPGASSNDTTPATTQYVTTAIGNLVDTAPSTLNTLNELAAALGDDVNFSTTVTNSIALKAPLANPNFTGQIQVSNAASTIQELTVTGNNTRSTLRLNSKDSSGNSVDLRMHSLGDGPRGEIFTYSNHPLAFATNNAAPQMTLLTNGNFGIGPSSPLDKLDVAGSLRSQHDIVSNTDYTILKIGSNRTVNDYGGLNKNYFTMSLATPGAGTNGGSNAHAYGDLRFNLVDGSDTTLHPKMILTYTGDLLLNGDGSTENLNVLSGTPKIQIGNGQGHSSLQFYSKHDAVGALYFGDGTSGTNRYPGYIEYRHSNDTMAFRVDGEERFQIETSGIEVSGGTATTSVSQIGFTNYADTAYLRSKYYDPSATTETYLAFHTNKSGASNGTVAEHMRLKGNRLGINITAPEAMLHVKNPDGGNATDKASMLSEAVMKLQPHATNSTNMLVAQVDGGSSMGIQVTNGPATANWDLALSPFGGNVGIATVDPAYALEVKKSVNSDWLSRIYNTSTTDGSGLLVRSDTADSQATTIFGVYSGGSYKMFVKGDGSVTQPKQPTAIYTHSNNTEDGCYNYTYAGTGARTVIARPQTAVVNRGSMYTPSNGRFTAPQAGVYRYAVHGNLYTFGLAASAYWTWRIFKNTAHYIYHYESNSTRAANGWIYCNCGGIIEMAANDYLRFELKTNNLSSTVGFGMDLNSYTHYEFQLLY